MANAKVLFIDDDNFLRKVYQAELKEKGFDVSLAVDGEDGLAKIPEVNPDLIILDLIMPKKNGFEVLAALQKFDETRNIPVIVLSNLAQSTDQKKALDLGAVDYLVKDNTTLDIIAEKIEYHINEAGKKQPAQRTQKKSGSLGIELQAASSKSNSSVPKKEDKKPEPEKKETTAKLPHNFCTQCGQKLAANAKFCPNCGTQV